MNDIFDIINIPIGWILKFFNDLCNNNFALAIIFLTIVANLIVVPLSMHSQRSTSKQARLRPKLDLLKQKFGDDKMKYNEAMQKLYAQEGVSMTGGCLPMLLRLPFFIGVFNVVRSPLTYVCGVNKTFIENAFTVIKGFSETTLKNLNINLDNLTELDIIKNFDAVKGTMAEGANEIGAAIDSVNFNLFGLNLADKPSFGMNFDAVQLIWLIPIFSFLTAMITSIVSSRIQKKLNPDTPTMGCIVFGMPIISLVIAFSVPGAVGFYWACSNLVSGAIQVLLQLYYGPNHIIAKEQVRDTLKRYASEKKKLN